MKTFSGAISLVVVSILSTLLVASPSWAAKSLSVDAAGGASARRAGDAQLTQPGHPYDDTRLVEFEFNPNLTYEIKTRADQYTHIEIAPGDKIRGFYPSNRAGWQHHIANNKKRLFIKPSTSGLFNSATVVTDHRVYELVFVSDNEEGEWHKRVTWRYTNKTTPPPPLVVHPDVTPVSSPSVVTEPTRTVVVSREQWRIRAGDRISTVMSSWGKMSGWSLAWDAPEIVSMMDVAVDGQFEEVIGRIVDALNQGGAKIHAQFYDGNRVLRITEKK